MLIMTYYVIIVIYYSYVLIIQKFSAAGSLLHIVRRLTFFHCNVFEKRFNTLDQCLVPSITKRVISYSLILEQKPFIVL